MKLDKNLIFKNEKKFYSKIIFEIRWIIFLFMAFTLNEYYIDTIIEEKDGKIDKVILYFTMSWIHIVLDFGHFLYKKKKLFSSTLSWIFRNFDH